MEKTSLYAYISFTGKDDVDDFPVEVVTEMLGVQPTTILRMGERINDVHTRSFTSWQYESETLETLDVDDVLLPILNFFQDKADSINRLKEELNLNVQIELVITMIDGYTPGLVISPQFSRFASAINAFIDIDMYIYPFSEPEE
ncbi:hypothetical protein DCE79_12035 [Lysinibacillus sp. 2017]|uniref:DUF4279 domain-containing protein n=1 Tax=unclassified Lysinibacillus TaxID=2636778 RepID=UPI000D528101|nr:MULTISPECIES: DUF4279 domain-containing protein [unclassified Lysinibacillus]AWE08071.1 hypothetical protein DCE79_12035 [Lysinibacillus sp. 2017]TGN36424.1 DUF4279 domain-containing protein [Lysinibacillus sp. S2017]